MPREINYLRQCVVIAKRDIARYAAMHGCANERPIVIGDREYEIGQARFATFAGARADDGFYYGEYLFEPGMFSNGPWADLNELPGKAGQEAD